MLEFVVAAAAAVIDDDDDNDNDDVFVGYLMMPFHIETI